MAEFISHLGSRKIPLIALALGADKANAESSKKITAMDDTRLIFIFESL